MTANNIIAFPPRSIEGEIRAEAERRGMVYDDFLVDLALKGWEKRGERDERHARSVADHALDYAEYDHRGALAILKQAARVILKAAKPPPEPEDVA